jgi:hypothetical protein
MIKNFNLKLNSPHEQRMEIDNIIIDDIQNTVIELLNRNTSFNGTLISTNSLNSNFYLGGTN